MQVVVLQRRNSGIFEQQRLIKSTMAIDLLHTEIILYVNDQQAAKLFYERLLGMAPVLDVPGMTEFVLSDSCKLGLMPNKGIARLLGDKTPHPESGTGIPRCELYLRVADAEAAYTHALQCGARLLLPIAEMEWGDTVCYFSDADGHIIAFAATTPNLL
jgi:catechol 2,3-dioxygenase-like lactoylglutathione lyase family enzyme